MSEVFNIGHEVDLSEYTTTVTDGGKLSQGTPGLANTAGRMEVFIDDTTNKYGQKDFTQPTSTSVRFRFYLDPNNLSMGSSDRFYPFKLEDGGADRTRVELGYDGADYYISAGLRDDGGTFRDTANYTITDAEHYLEILCTKATNASSNDGEISLWIDGTLKENRTDVDWFNLSLPDVARLGAVSNLDAGTSGTFHLDELVVRDDDTEIGALAAAAGYAWVF